MVHLKYILYYTGTPTRSSGPFSIVLGKKEMVFDQQTLEGITSFSVLLLPWSVFPQACSLSCSASLLFWPLS